MKNKSTVAVCWVKINGWSFIVRQFNFTVRRSNKLVHSYVVNPVNIMATEKFLND